MNDTYNSIKQKSEGLFKDKGSKFIAYAFPVTNEEQIKEIIAEIKKEHYSARHHCYAYRLGPEGEKYRANDDGEPSGTAGRPILGQLLSYDLTNVLIVVVRYFGGTLLGVSGLINAYKNAAMDVLSHSEIIEHVVEKHYCLLFEYPMQSQVMRVIKDFNLEIINAEYEMNCKISIAVRLNLEEQILDKFELLEGVKVNLCT